MGNWLKKEEISYVQEQYAQPFARSHTCAQSREKTHTHISRETKTSKHDNSFVLFFPSSTAK